jgi:NADH:ubiquinone reductase (non-electrogenic)
MAGADGIFAIGDCTSTSYAPTAQVASQQGAYLARVFGQLAKKDNLEAKLIKLQQEATSAADPERKAEISQALETAEKQMSKVKLRPFHYSHQGSLAYVLDMADEILVLFLVTDTLDPTKQLLICLSRMATYVSTVS